jgi:hypothetical protein
VKASPATARIASIGIEITSSSSFGRTDFSGGLPRISQRASGASSRRKIPVVRLRPIAAMSRNRATAPPESRASRRRVWRVTTTTVIVAAAPRTRVVLKVFEPITLPSASAPSPLAAANPETRPSGRLVPAPTRTAPMNIGLAPSAAASREAPLMNWDAAIASTTSAPATSRRSVSSTSAHLSLSVGPGADLPLPGDLPFDSFREGDRGRKAQDLAGLRPVACGA